MKYAFIKANREEFSVGAMCRVLKASKGGYYAWLSRPVCAREKRDAELREKIVAIHTTSKSSYGSPRVHAALVEPDCGRNRVARIMRAAGIAGKRRRSFTPRTTDSNHQNPIAANILDRKFSPDEVGRPNRCWAGDITYIRTREGWLYLAVVLDLFSRRVVGWSMSASMKTRFVLDALQSAIDGRGAPEGLVWHSDRGVQYTDGQTRALADQHGIQCSMSRKGNCWDNAVVESFWASLKSELFDDYIPTTREEARALIFNWIEAWYNRQRLHSTLGYLSPAAFELKKVS